LTSCARTIPHDGAKISLDAKKDPREGKTAFIAVLLAFLRDYFRVDHDYPLFRVFAAGTIHYEQTLWHTDLHRGQTYARRGVHGFEHVVDELLKIAVEFGDWISRFVEHRIRPGNYL